MSLQTLLAQTFPGSPAGMNVALPQWELDDTECRYLQDGLLDVPGLMRRRGPVQAVSGLVALTRKGTALVETLNPQGVDRYAVLNGSDVATGFLSVYDSVFASVADIPWPHIMPTSPQLGISTAYRNAIITPGLTGGTWLGVSSAWDSNSPVSGLGFWRGAGKVNYAAGTLTVTKGTAVVAGAGTLWAANVESGMFLFANTDDPYTSTYIGHVLSVNSDTSITIAAVSPYTATAKAYTLTSLRGFGKTVTKGRITCDVASVTVNGGATKWRSEGVGTGSWDLYRQSDGVWIGKVSAVVTDTTITLAGNAAIALTDELYLAVRADNWSVGRNIDITESALRVGWCTGVYAGRQWYANNGSSFEKTYRVWFSDLNNPESVDLTNDGDWIPVNSTANLPEPIRAIIPTYNSLLVFKDSETFAIYGSSPASFTVKKLEDDGIMSSMAVQSYGGGAIWAGRSGIHFYDGVTVQNLTADKLGKVWKNSVLNIDPTRYRAWSMMVRDHYILHIENLAPTIAVVKGNTSVTPSQWTVVINMNTKAITLCTNVGVRGSVILPSKSGRDVWYLVNGANPTTGTTTLGKTIAGLTGLDLAADTMYAVKKTATSNGVIGSVKFRVDGNGSGAGVQSLRASIYSDVAGVATTKAAESAIVTVTHGAAASDLQFTLTTPLRIVNGTAYWIVLHAGTGTNSARVFEDVVGGASITGAATFATGSPTAFGTNTADNKDMTAYWVYDPDHAAIADTQFFFDAEGVDPIIGDNSVTAGPDFFYESKKFNAGDDQLLKRWKQLNVHYLAQGGNLNIDTVLGLNNVGNTLTSNFPASVYTWDTIRIVTVTWDAMKAQFGTWASVVSGVFQPKRVRFLKKSQHFSFRLWQSSAAMTRVQVGPFKVLWKAMREGRV